MAKDNGKIIYKNGHMKVTVRKNNTKGKSFVPYRYSSCFTCLVVISKIRDDNMAVLETMRQKRI